MANPDHLEILKQGTEKWNEWRALFPDVKPDLQKVEIRGGNLRGVNLSETDLYLADLSGTDLSGANLSFGNLCSTNLNDTLLIAANLNEAKLIGALLCRANLTDANLSYAYLHLSVMINANLTRAILKDAQLIEADLFGATLVETKLTNVNMVNTNFSTATITGCHIYGISAWDLNLENTIQKDLVISKKGDPIITIDDLLVAQFIYLLLNNKNIRNVLDSISSKAVLILGRFADPQYKVVLNGLREKMRQFNLLPIVFDFDRPQDKDYTETVQTLAGISKFVIADITNSKSTPLELEATVKQFKIPYVPIINTSLDPRPFAMLVDSQKSFHWVLPTLHYETKEDLLDDDNLKEFIIDPVNKKCKELRKAKNEEPEPILIRKRNSNPSSE